MFLNKFKKLLIFLLVPLWVYAQPQSDLEASQVVYAEGEQDPMTELAEVAQDKKKFDVDLGLQLDTDYVNSSRSIDFIEPGIDQIVQALTELSTTIKAGDWVSTRWSFVSLQDPYDIYRKYRVRIDEGFFTLGNFNKLPFYFVAGKYYLPFGVYKKHTLTSTMTKDISEIHRNATGIGFKTKYTYGSVYFFANSGHINDNPRTFGPVGKNFGLELGAAQGYKRWGYSFYAGYLSDLTQTNALSDLGPILISQNPAIALHTELYYRVWGIILNFTSAIHHYNATGIEYQGHGARPSAFSAQVYQHFRLFTRASSVALNYDFSNEALGVFLPKTRFMLSLSTNLNRYMELILQFQHERDYSINNFAGFVNRAGEEVIFGTSGVNNTFAARLSISLGSPSSPPIGRGL